MAHSNLHRYHCSTAHAPVTHGGGEYFQAASISQAGSFLEAFSPPASSKVR